MSEKQTIYLGSGKATKNPKLVNFTIGEDKIKEEYWSEFNGKRFLSLTLITKDEADQYGKTHSVVLNEYQKENQF